MLACVIRRGLVIDGTGSRAFAADVGIAGGRIARVGHVDEGETGAGTVVIDAAGRCVAPGFIDMHSHSDLTLPVHARAESSICQGITTEVAGSCGWSMAPAKIETVRGVLRGLLRGLTGITPKELKFTWFSFAEYARFLAGRGIGTNLYPVLGQSLLRAHVVGLAKRPATAEELSAMRAMLRQAMEEGCRGLSAGRSYAPGCHGDVSEIASLCEEVRPFGGIYSAHVKDEAAEVIAAVEEVIEVARRSGVKAEVSHHKAIGKANFGRVAETLGLIEQARSEGLDVNCDVYPYDFAQVVRLRDSVAGRWRSRPPEWVLEQLRDAAARASLRPRTPRGPLKSPENYVIISAPGSESMEGLTLAEAAAATADPFDFCCDLLVSTGLGAEIAARMDEADVRTVLSHPLTMVGTDAFTIDGPPREGLPVHPRHYGTFPRVLGRYVREAGLFDLVTAVRKVTAMPAAKLGLADRGVVAEDCWADLVVFDPHRIADRATGKEPALPPEGIDYVLVNGEVAQAQGKRTGAQAGKVLLQGQ
jgi:N-acyl-D-amino-acid deacylase